MFRLISVAVADMSLEALVFLDDRFQLRTFVPGKIVNAVNTSSQEALGWNTW